MKKSKVRQPTPKQALYIKYYADPKSATFGNARQSALRAGYTENYANRINNDAPRTIEFISNKSERIEYESNVQAIFYLVQVPVKPPVQAF